jgi:putative oxidoreductase
MMFGLDRLAGPLLSVLRIVTGLLFLEHGTSKLLHFPPTAMFAHAPPTFSLIWFSGVLEFVGGALIAIGLFTSPVAFLLAGEMAIAYWIVHAPQSPFPLVSQGEGAVLYCFVFLYFAAAGGGPWSLDAVLRKRPT